MKKTILLLAAHAVAFAGFGQSVFNFKSTFAYAAAKGTPVRHVNEKDTASGKRIVIGGIQVTACRNASDSSLDFLFVTKGSSNFSIYRSGMIEPYTDPAAEDAEDVAERRILKEICFLTP